MSVGFRVLERKRRADIHQVEKFRRLPVANVSDSMSRMTAGGPRLRPVHLQGKLAGPALTVKTDRATISARAAKRLSDL